MLMEIKISGEHSIIARAVEMQGVDVSISPPPLRLDLNIAPPDIFTAVGITLDSAFVGGILLKNIDLEITG